MAIDGDDSGWNSLSHAALIAQREKGAQLHGLHIVSAKSKRQGPQIEALQNTFSERCRQLDLSGRLAIDSGKRINRICQRARYTDLTVVCLSCGPAAKKLGEGLRTLLRSCPRPMLMVSAVKSPLDSMLLAYDGSELFREALYTAAYLASQWDIKLAVLTAHDNQVSADKTQQQARHYLETHGIEASYVIKTKIAIVEAILDTAKEQSSNLILMGAYGRNAPRYINVGIAVAECRPRSLLWRRQWKRLLLQTDQALRADNDAGFTTLIAFAVLRNRLYGAACGDSALMAVTGYDIQVLTFGQMKHPPIGSGKATAFGFKRSLAPPWKILAMTDGFWKFAGWEQIQEKALESSDPEMMIESIRGAAANSVSSLQDDFTLLVIQEDGMPQAG